MKLGFDNSFTTTGRTKFKYTDDSY